MRSFSIVRDSFTAFVENIATSMGLSKLQKKHMGEYLLGLMIPTYNRRKSVNAINRLVGMKNQSSLNCFLNNMDPQVLNDQWIFLHLKEEIGRKEVYFVTDDTHL